jgi:hypothetical protein
MGDSSIVKVISDSFDARGEFHPAAIFLSPLRERFIKDREATTQALEELAAQRRDARLANMEQMQESTRDRIGKALSTGDEAQAQALRQQATDIGGNITATQLKGQKRGGLLAQLEAGKGALQARNAAGGDESMFAKRRAAIAEVSKQSGMPASAEFASPEDMGTASVAIGQAQRTADIQGVKEKDVHRANTAVTGSKEIAVHEANSREDERRMNALDVADEERTRKKAAEARLALVAFAESDKAIPEEQKPLLNFALNSLPKDSPLLLSIFDRVTEGATRRVPQTTLTGVATTAVQGDLQKKALEFIEAAGELRLGDAIVSGPDGVPDSQFFEFATAIEENAENFINQMGADTYTEVLQKKREAQYHFDHSLEMYIKAQSGLETPNEQVERLRAVWMSTHGGVNRYLAKREVVLPLVDRKVNLASRMASGRVTLEQAQAEHNQLIEDTITQLRAADEEAMIQEALEKGVDISDLVSEAPDEAD